MFPCYGSIAPLHSRYIPGIQQKSIHLTVNKNHGAGINKGFLLTVTESISLEKRIIYLFNAFLNLKKHPLSLLPACFNQNVLCRLFSFWLLTAAFDITLEFPSVSSKLQTFTDHKMNVKCNRIEIVTRKDIDMS